MRITQSSESQEITRLYREFEEIYHIMALQSGLSDSAFLIFYARRRTPGIFPAVSEVPLSLPSKIKYFLIRGLNIAMFCRKIFRSQPDKMTSAGKSVNTEF